MEWMARRSVTSMDLMLVNFKSSLTAFIALKK
jgi:hypothetical protein